MLRYALAGLRYVNESVIVKLRNSSDDAAQKIFNELGQGITLNRNNDVYSLAFNKSGV